MAPNAEKAAGPSRALLIESDRADASHAEQLLNDFGYTVVVVRSPSEALSVLSRVPRLVIVDAKAPVDGVAYFLERIHKMRDLEGVPAIATCGRRLPDDEQVILREQGVVAFLDKPLREEELADALYLADSESLSSLPEVEPEPMRRRRASPRSNLPFRPVGGVHMDSTGRPAFSMGSSGGMHAVTEEDIANRRALDIAHGRNPDDITEPGSGAPTDPYPPR
jgi:CheY-like chemotaxis protein